MWVTLGLAIAAAVNLFWMLTWFRELNKNAFLRKENEELLKEVEDLIRHNHEQAYQIRQLKSK